MRLEASKMPPRVPESNEKDLSTTSSNAVNLLKPLVTPLAFPQTQRNTFKMYQELHDAPNLAASYNLVGPLIGHCVSMNSPETTGSALASPKMTLVLCDFLKRHTTSLRHF